MHACLHVNFRLYTAYLLGVQLDRLRARYYRRYIQYDLTFYLPKSCFKGWILAAFFYGYTITQVPGGWLATKFGGKYVFGIGIVMTAVLTLLTPLAAQVSVWALVALRVAEGMFEVCLKNI